jgi:hypothetical protein
MYNYSLNVKKEEEEVVVVVVVMKEEEGIYTYIHTHTTNFYC